MPCVVKVKCDKEPCKQEPVGKKVYSFTRNLGEECCIPIPDTPKANVLVLGGKTLRIYFVMFKFAVSGCAEPLNPMPYQRWVDMLLGCYCL